jgi:thiol:disulfide interchange protein DsbD
MRYKTISIFSSLFICLFFVANAYAQTPKFNITATADKAKLSKGETANISVQVKLPSPWYTYSIIEQLNKEGIGPTPTEFNFEPNGTFEINGNVTETKLHSKDDAGFEMKINYHKGNFGFTIPVKALKNVDFTKDKIQVLSYMQLCDTARCLPPEDYKAIIKVDATATAETTSVEAPPVVDSAITNNATADTQAIEPTTPAVEESLTSVMTESQKEIEEKKSEGIWAFLWFAMGAGALALLTPCVFPMIPITVSFFTKRSEKGKTNAVRDAFVYAIGIMLTFTGLGVLLAIIFGATGIRDFATNGWINLFIAAIFIIFAFNLFGSFEIQLPTGMMNKLNKKSNEGSGIISVLLMALTFSITSFTCTVPFVGSTLVAASGGDWFEPIIGMIGFSGVFAAPFFLLALFPSVMKKLPKAGGWMNNVKVVMGFIEIAAAFKFLSNADLVWSWGFLNKEVFLSIWIIICLLIVLYILGVFRMSHDSPVESVKTSRIVWSIFFGAVGFYLLTGLFGKTLGELDAFLPPAEYRELMSADDMEASSMMPPTIGNTANTSQENNEMVWLSDYQQGLEQAKATGRPMLIDFTGFTCTNCRWMEQNMFKRAEVSTRMNEFVKVQLFTDRRKEPYISNKKLQQETYGSIELPLYVIISPDGKHVGTETFTRDINEFVAFLDKGLATKK